MYKKVLLKVSGEALSGDKRIGIDRAILEDIAKQIKKVHDLGIQIAITIGGGNFWRGRDSSIKGKVAADQMGMIATVMNGIAICDALKEIGIIAKLLSPVAIEGIVEKFYYNKAIEFLDNGAVVVFTCGTGNPFFTTDSGAVLKAIEIGAEVILMAKNIDGIYDSDPNKNKNAKKIDKITYEEVFERNLAVMDMTAITLCKEHRIPIKTFALKEKNSILNVINGNNIGTLVY